MGIEDDKAEQIINAHLETVNPLKQERDDLKEKSGKVDSIQKQLDEANKKLKEYEDSGEKDSWKVKYDAAIEDKKKVEKEFNDYKADIASKELLAKKKDAYRGLLKATGVSEKRLDAILKVTDLSAVELDDDGKIKGSAELEKSIKEEWADFIGQVETQGAKVSYPQGASGTGNEKKPEVSKPMSRAAQLAAQYHKEHYGTKGE